MTATRATRATGVGGPRPLWCVIEREHRDLSTATSAVAGRFVHHGVLLHLGRRPDWLNAGLPHDEEWRIEWVELYEGLDMAHAYGVTGDPVYLRTWEDLVESFCDQVSIGHHSSDVTARRLQNWLYAWLRFTEAANFPGLSMGLADRLAMRIKAEARHLADHLTAERNHRTLELYTLLLVSLAFDPDPGPDLDPDPQPAAEEILELLGSNAARDIWSDGVHRECSTDYHMLVLRSLLGAVENGRRAGLAIPSDLLTGVERACDFAVHIQRPDGTTPSFSDGDPADFRALLADAATVLGRADLAWVASGGTQGTPPADRLVSFPVGGYHIQRGGWGDGRRAYQDERFAMFDCGPIGDGGHGHYDQLSVELAGGGHTLALDPGGYTYADDDDGWRHWFKGTSAHNTVTVDGFDQTPYRPGKPRLTSTATLLGRWSPPGIDVLSGEVTSPSHDARHRRTLALVNDDFWVIHDQLSGQSPHTYVARWHLSPEAQGRTFLIRDDQQSRVSAPGLTIIVPRWCGDVTVEEGWVSPTYGVKVPAPIVAITAADLQDADLVSVILVGSSHATVTARCAEGGAVVFLDRPDIGRDRVRCGPNPQRHQWRPGS